MDEEMVSIYTARDETEAKIVKSLLEDAGIAVWEKSDFAHTVHPFAATLSDEQLCVPKSQAEEAIALLEDYESEAETEDAFEYQEDDELA